MSSLATCLASDPNLSCGLPDKFSPDGDIAGRGVFCAFTFAVASSLAGALFVLYAEGREYFGIKDNRSHMFRIRMFADSYLVSLSDTQAVTTLALLISAYFFVGCTISAYHYDLVCSLVLMSSAAYIGSMVVIHRYFDTKWWLVLPRAAMILFNFGLAFRLFSHRSAIFPSFRPLSNVNSMTSPYNTGLVLPATCFIDHPGASNTSNPHNFTASPGWTTNATSPTDFNASSINRTSNTSTPLTNATMPTFAPFASNDDISSIGDLIALGFLCVAFILAALTSVFLFLSKGNPSRRHKIAFIIRCCLCLTAYVIAWYGFARFSQLWDWMNDSGWFADGDDEKKIDSFGQLMPLVLLALPILALTEQFAAKKSPAERNSDDNGSTSSRYGLK